MKRKMNKGFTLAELLIVVAIIAVLVAISIPIFTSQLEKSREAADMANVRSACEGRRSATLREVREAFGREFASCHVVPEWEDEPEKPGNNVFIAR